MTPDDIFDFNQWFLSEFAPRLGVRSNTIYQALMLALARGAKTIVETGCMRGTGTWDGDGFSTFIWAAFAKRYGAKVYSCDIDKAAVEHARAATAQFAPHIEMFAGDSVQFLSNFHEPIDFLYLDSMDFNQESDPNPPQDHALREGQAARKNLHMQSIVLIDDCRLLHGGKGGKVIPFFLGQGWQVIGIHYQVLLAHQVSTSMFA